MMITVVACQNKNKTLMALAGLSVCTKARFVPGLLGQTEGFLAYFEYADVGFIIAWTCHYVYVKGKPYTVAIHERAATTSTSTGGGADPSLFMLSAFTLANVVLVQPVVRLLQNIFFRSNALHCTATARMLIPAECSAVS